VRRGLDASVPYGDPDALEVLRIGKLGWRVHRLDGEGVLKPDPGGQRAKPPLAFGVRCLADRRRFFHVFYGTRDVAKWPPCTGTTGMVSGMAGVRDKGVS
jgi:hypothetical protein